MTIKLIILAAGTLILLWFTWWASIKEKRYHGLWRFFVFESILALVVLNSGAWFREPFSLRQIASWTLLALSLLAAVIAFYQLFKMGKPKGQMENTTVLINRGLYGYIRHPMYLSLVLLAAGAFVKQLSVAGAALLLVNLASAYATAKVEEKEMLARFGPAYADYMKTTRRFIPFLF